MAMFCTSGEAALGVGGYAEQWKQSPRKGSRKLLQAAPTVIGLEYRLRGRPDAGGHRNDGTCRRRRGYQMD